MLNPTMKVALESGTDFATTDFSFVMHIADYAKMKLYGLPTEGIYIESDKGDYIIYDEDVPDWFRAEGIHPNYMTID